MSYLVQKFGGTSVGDLERIENVAEIIASEVRKSNKVIAIVSAMSGETNRLVEQVKKMSSVYDGREYDVIVSTGENITAGLLAIKLQDLGIPARSWMGWQIPIITTSMHCCGKFVFSFHIAICVIQTRAADEAVGAAAKLWRG